MNSPRMLPYFLLFAFATSLCCGQEEYRTWNSKNTDHQLEATLVKVEGDVVFLKTREGRTVEVELAKLSDADNQYVRDKSGAASKRNDSARTKTKPKTSRAKEITFSMADSWNVEPDRFVESVQVSTERISLGNKMMLSGDLLISHDRSTMFAFYRSDLSNKVVQKIDLVSGEKAGEAFEIPRSVPLDVSPDKKLFMAGSSGRRAIDQDVLNIVHYGDKLHPLVTFQPYGEHGNLSYAQFVDDNHFITVSAEGLLGLWNISQLKLLWHAQITPGSRPALSANRKLLFAHVNGTHLVALDARAGTVFGKQPCPLKGVAQLAVNDSCTKLVGVGMGACRQWDLSTGELVADFAVSAALQNPDAKFVNDNQVLVCNFRGLHRGLYDLVDLDLQCSVWVYGFWTTPAVGLNGKLWFALKKDSEVPGPEIACETIPHPEAAQAINSASKGDLSYFEPSSKIPIDITSQGSQWNLDNVEAYAKEFVSDSGFGLSLRRSDPGFSVTLIRPKPANDGNIYENIALVEMVLRSKGKAVWRPGRTMEFYQQDARERVSIFDDPWRGIVLPKTFRFFKPVLDGSYPDQDGFKSLTYERNYEESFRERWTTGSGPLPPLKNTTTKNPVPRKPGVKFRW